VKAGCRVKICGITNRADAEMAAGEGADYAGVVIEVSYSPRSQKLESASPLFESAPAPVVALVHEMPEARLSDLVTRLRPFAVQFLSPDGVAQADRLKKIMPGLQIWQSLFLPAAGESEAEFDPGVMIGQIGRCREFGVDAVVLDTAAVLKGVMRMGGTGRTGRWDYAAMVVAASPLPAFLAGGIRPENVREAIMTVKPYGIDLSSGVEIATGKKSQARLKALMDELKAAVAHDKGDVWYRDMK